MAPTSELGPLIADLEPVLPPEGVEVQRQEAGSLHTSVEEHAARLWCKKSNHQPR